MFETIGFHRLPIVLNTTMDVDGVHQDGIVMCENNDSDSDVRAEDELLEAERECDTYAQDEIDLESSSKTCFPVWEAKWSRKTKVERVLKLRPETESLRTPR